MNGKRRKHAPSQKTTNTSFRYQLDDAQVDGILGTEGFLDYRKVPDERIVDSVVSKVREYNKANNIVYDLVRVEDILAKQGIGQRGKADQRQRYEDHMLHVVPRSRYPKGCYR
jgi:hypothetical protein